MILGLPWNNHQNNLGHGVLLAKADIKSVFQLLPVSPQDFKLLGFQFKNKYHFPFLDALGHAHCLKSLQHSWNICYGR